MISKVISNELIMMSQSCAFDPTQENPPLGNIFITEIHEMF